MLKCRLSLRPLSGFEIHMYSSKKGIVAAIPKLRNVKRLNSFKRYSRLVFNPRDVRPRLQGSVLRVVANSDYSQKSNPVYTVAKSSPKISGGHKKYVIESGDTLYSVAQDHSLTVNEVVQLNPEWAAWGVSHHARSANLPTGLVLKVPKNTSSSHGGGGGMVSQLTAPLTRLSSSPPPLAPVSFLCAALGVAAGFTFAKMYSKDSPGPRTRSVEEDLGDAIQNQMEMSAKVEEQELELEAHSQTETKLKLMISLLKADLENRQADLESLQARIRRMIQEGQLASNAAQAKEQRLKDQMEELQMEADMLGLRCDTLERQSKGMEIKEEEKQMRVEEKDALEKQQLRGQLKARETTVADLEVQVDGLTSALDAVKKETSALRVEKDTGKVLMDKVLLELEATRTRADQAKQMMEDAEERARAAVDKEAELRAEVKALREELSKTKKRAEVQLDKLQGRMSTLITGEQSGKIIQDEIAESAKDWNEKVEKDSSKEIIALKMKLTEKEEALAQALQDRSQLQDEIADLEMDNALALTQMQGQVREALQQSDSLEEEVARLRKQLVANRQAGDHHPAAVDQPSTHHNVEANGHAEHLPEGLVMEGLSLSEIVRAQKQLEAESSGGLRVVMSSVARPHPAKKHYGGEDACFTSHIHSTAAPLQHHQEEDARSQEGWFCLGVADGVGGWGAEGVNPGEYSSQFMERCEAALAEVAGAEEVKDKPEAVLRGAIAFAHQSVTLPGSTTACLLMKPPGSSTLHTANIGDSGCRVIRDSRVIYRSKVQQYEFNTPYQLGHPSHMPETDSAMDAQTDQVELRKGDIIILGTDGLFDNCFDEELIEVSGGLAGSEITENIVKECANELAELAHKKAKSGEFETPWSREIDAQEREAPFASTVTRVAPSLGGKLDDVTVVVGYVDVP